MIVVDTNVVSELMRASPAAHVRDWARGQETRELYTTAVTVAEIGYGIERLPSGRRQDALRAEAAEIFGVFSDRILAFDAEAAALYALVVSRRDELGLPIEGFDAQIAAICRAREATVLATRNIKDFQETGVHLVNPWHADS